MTSVDPVYKEYVSDTVSDLANLKLSITASDEQLPDVFTLVKDDGAEGGYRREPVTDASADEKREALRQGPLARLSETYGTNLGILGGPKAAAENFFEALDEVFQAATGKPEDETLLGYLERKILDPIKSLLDTVEFNGDPALTKAKELYEAVKEKIPAESE